MTFPAEISGRDRCLKKKVLSANRGADTGVQITLLTELTTEMGGVKRFCLVATLRASEYPPHGYAAGLPGTGGGPSSGRMERPSDARSSMRYDLPF